VIGGVFLLDSKPVELNVLKNEFGELEVWKAGCVKPVVIGGGKLGGLLSAFNELGGIADLRAKLDEFAKSFMAEFDTAHAFGVGIDGSFDRLRSSRPVSDTSVPLSQADTVLPVQAGNLFISVTDNASGDSTLSQINIDPATQSLADIAAAISTVGNLNAVVDSAGGMTITAQAGYSFDFTGNLQTRPDPALITGDTEPQIFGAYEGTTNDDFTFTFLGSGTVGVDAGLQVEVRNSSGVVVRVLDVGKTYEPGSRLQVGDGVQLALSSGVANLGDSFQSQVISQPDETGFLAALGINTLFTGGGAADMRINPLLDEDPNRLATTTIGDPNDTRNLLRMMQLRESRELANGTQTYEQYLAAIIASVGQEVRDLTLASENSIEFRQLLETEINTISGVDINEELVRMLEFQRGFQAAARYIAVLDEALQDLLDMIR